MADLLEISIPERGHREIDYQLWEKLSGNNSFWHLIDKKRLKITHINKHKIRLEGLSYVGRAVIDDVVLEVTGKIKGALPSLLKFATHNAFNVDLATAPTTEIGNLVSLLVHQFLEAVKKYVSRGREFHYTKQHEVGSLVSGKIDVTKTISLRARGLGHLAAFDRNIVSRNTEKNQILLAAISEVERLSNIVDLLEVDITAARGFSMIFDDCRSWEVLFSKREDLARKALLFANRGEDPLQKDMLMLASVILSHESFEYRDVITGSTPRSWFLNLETLFQKAVKRVLETLCSSSIQVLQGSDFTVPIYDTGKGGNAYPDLVINSNSKTLAVGDVKYKEWISSASRSDIYQLLVHTSAFKSSISFLIFPSEKFEFVELGVAATNSKTWLFAVDINNLKDSLEKVLSIMKISSL